jgi:hypothetical protein
MSAVDSFGFKMIKYGDNLTDVNRKATVAAALVYKSGVLSSAAGFTGGDRRFSKWKGKQGPALGAGFEVGGSKVHSTAFLKARPMGIWWVLEYGSPAHIIKPRKRKGLKALKFSDGGFASGSVVHPGRHGTNAWAIGIRSSQAGAMQAYKRTQKLGLIEAHRH